MTLGEPFLVIFDLDGTLVDSAALIVSAMAAAFEARGHPAPTADAVRQVVGLALDEAIETLSPNAHPDSIDTMVDAYKSAFAELRAGRSVPEALFPGARDTVVRLSTQGYALAIATGKSQRGMVDTLHRFDLRRYFDSLQCADNAPGKPHPAMVEQALAETGIDRSRAILVGDTTFDMALAGNAGIPAVAVSWGNHDVSVLRAAGAAHVLDDFGQLDEILETVFAPVRP